LAKLRKVNLLKGLDDLGVELSARPRPQFVQSFQRTTPRLIGPIGNHRVKGIGDR